MIERTFHRNGQLRELVPLRNGRRHGVVRVWHKNGVQAGEETYQNGLLHGLCRQWNEAGRLLGKYRMVHGTGVQRVWHENGRLQLEFSTVRGDFSGRYRLWFGGGVALRLRWAKPSSPLPRNFSRSPSHRPKPDNPQTRAR